MAGLNKKQTFTTMGFSIKTILILVAAMVVAMIIYDFVSTKIFSYEEE